MSDLYISFLASRTPKHLQTFALSMEFAFDNIRLYVDPITINLVLSGSNYSKPVTKTF